MTRRAWLVLLWLGLSSGCEDMTRPQEPVWDKEVCAHCHMLLSDPRFAAQATTRDQRRLHFDDVGCLAAFAEEDQHVIERSWVRAGTGWQDTSVVRFEGGASTPMGFGFVVRAGGSLDFAGVRRAVSATLAQGSAR